MCLLGVRDSVCENVCARACSRVSGSRDMCTGGKAENGCVRVCVCTFFFPDQKLNIFLFSVNSLAFLDSVILPFLEEKQLNAVHRIPWMELEVVPGGEEEGMMEVYVLGLLG